MIADFSSLVQALQSDGASLQSDPANGSIKIPVVEEWIESVLWLRWDLEHTLLHVILPYHETIPSEYLPATATLITQINHRLLMPGFGLDHEHRTAYFRLTASRGEGGTLTLLEIRKLLRTTVETTRDFAPVVRAVAQDGKSPAEALALFRTHNAASA